MPNRPYSPHSVSLTVKFSVDYDSDYDSDPDADLKRQWQAFQRHIERKADECAPGRELSLLWEELPQTSDGLFACRLSLAFCINAASRDTADEKMADWFNAAITERDWPGFEIESAVFGTF